MQKDHFYITLKVLLGYPCRGYLRNWVGMLVGMGSQEWRNCGAISILNVPHTIHKMKV